MKKLFIDTSRSDQTEVRFSVDGEETKESLSTQKEKSQAVLGIINSILSKTGVSIHDIDEIFVVEGPGSFTGLRVGLSVANTLSAFLDIPINNKRPGTIVDARYT